MARRLLIALVLGLVAVVAPACGGDEGGDGLGDIGGVDVDVQPTGVVVETDGTEIAIGVAEIPEGFPSEFPLPDGSEAVNSVAAPGSYSVWFTAPQAQEELKTFFDSGLPANGWTVASKTDFAEAEGTVTLYTINGHGFDGALYLGQAGAAAGFGGEFAFWVTLTEMA